MSVVWQLSRFAELDHQDIHDLFAARQKVFVVEQTCVYQDVDGLDMGAVHLLGRINDRVAAYARILPPGSKIAEPSIGRVLTTKPYRRQGLGREVMAKAIDYCLNEYDQQPIRISAQHYLEYFYREFGFVVVGTPYDEDGIPHIEMLRRGP